MSLHTTGTTTLSKSCTCHEQNCPYGPYRPRSRAKGPATTKGNTARGTESPVKQTCTCHCRMVVKRTMSTVLLVHIGHDAGHPRPDDARREHNARCNGTSKASVAHATDGTQEGVRGCQAPHPESLTQEAEKGGHMYWHGYPCASTRLLLPRASHQPRRH